MPTMINTEAARHEAVWQYRSDPDAQTMLVRSHAKDGPKRAIEYDVCRALFIISAVVLHVNNRLSLGELAGPSLLVQSYVATVGAFFFFTSGVMAMRVTRPKFQKDPIRTTRKCLRKGLMLVGVYFVYVTAMTLWVGRERPMNSVLDFVFNHPFMARVLLIFGLLFMAVPAILWLRERTRWAWAAVGGGALVIGAIGCWAPLLEGWSAWLFNPAFFVYSLPSAMICLTLGALWEDRPRTLDKRIAPYATVLLGGLALVLAIKVAVAASGQLSLFERAWLHPLAVPFRESLCIAVVLTLTARVLRLASARRTLLHPWLLCFGIESLTAFVVSCALVSLTAPQGGFGLTRNLAVFAIILFLTGISSRLIQLRRRALAQDARVLPGQANPGVRFEPVQDEQTEQAPAQAA